MRTEQEMLAWVEKATYEQLLSHWRFAPIGDPMFQNVKVSNRYKERMEELRLANQSEAVFVSKSIGWER